MIMEIKDKIQFYHCANCAWCNFFIILKSNFSHEENIYCVGKKSPSAQRAVQRCFFSRTATNFSVYCDRHSTLSQFGDSLVLDIHFLYDDVMEKNADVKKILRYVHWTITIHVLAQFEDYREEAESSLNYKPTKRFNRDIVKASPASSNWSRPLIRFLNFGSYRCYELVSSYMIYARISIPAINEHCWFFEAELFWSVERFFLSRTTSFFSKLRALHFSPTQHFT